MIRPELFTEAVLTARQRWTNAQRAALAAELLTPEVLAKAVQGHWLDTRWGTSHCGDDPDEHKCATAILTALRAAGKEPSDD